MILLAHSSVVVAAVKIAHKSQSNYIELPEQTHTPPRAIHLAADGISSGGAKCVAVVAMSLQLRRLGCALQAESEHSNGILELLSVPRSRQRCDER